MGGGVLFGWGMCFGTPMVMKRVVPIVGALVFALTLTGCGLGAGEGETSVPSSSAAATAPQRTEPYEQVPAEDREAFLRVLERADSGLVDGDNQVERGLRRAVYTCRDIEKDGLEGTRLAIYVSQRFSGGHGHVSIAEGRALAKAIRRYVCPWL